MCALRPRRLRIGQDSAGAWAWLDHAGSQASGNAGRGDGGLNPTAPSFSRNNRTLLGGVPRLHSGQLPSQSSRVPLREEW